MAAALSTPPRRWSPAHYPHSCLYLRCSHCSHKTARRPAGTLRLCVLHGERRSPSTFLKLHTLPRTIYFFRGVSPFLLISPLCGRRTKEPLRERRTHDSGACAARCSALCTQQRLTSLQVSTPFMLLAVSWQAFPVLPPRRPPIVPLHSNASCQPEAQHMDTRKQRDTRQRIIHGHMRKS